METKEYTTIDRVALGWPAGEWDVEPDKVQWQDEATGLPCLAVRNRRRGNWCGYVGVPPGHRLHGRDYEDSDFDVHGGLTFAGPCGPGEDESIGICHAPAPGEPEHVWWLGFDCSHAGDYSPEDVRLGAERGYPFTLILGDEYRPLAYVREQCRGLAAQVATAPCGDEGE